MSDSARKTRLTEAVDALTGARVGVVGDLVADVYISGLTDRVSREAPVLIVSYESEWLRPGGAANVAANIAALGATACLVGTVGEDDVGRDLVGLLTGTSSGASPGRAAAGGVECSQIIRATGRSTISKTRYLAGARLTHRQQVLRLDRQPAEPPDDEMIDRICRAVAATDADVDAWVASDYGYGGFNDKLRDLLRRIAAKKPVLADSRWDLPRFSGLTLLKPNEEEARSAAHVLGFCAADEAALATELAHALEAEAVLVTLGNKGMVLSCRGKVARIRAVGTEEIVDLTGAGDSVAATLAAAVAAGCDFESAAHLANAAGGVVVMKEGAATASPEEIKRMVTVEC